MGDRYTAHENGASGGHDEGQQQFNASFIRAVAHARGQHLLELERRAVRNRRYRSVLVLAGALMCLGTLALLMREGLGRIPLATPAIAEGFDGLTAVVISSYDRHVVSGIDVYELLSPPGGRPMEDLVAVTDGQGIFALQPDCRSAERQYVLKHNGEIVGQLLTGAGEHVVSGYQRILVDVPPQQLMQRYPATVAPGGETRLTGSLALALSADAQADWTGALLHDSRWPTEFNYGDVLEGILTVEGVVPPGLTLRVLIPREQLQLRRIEPAALRLIAHSADYAAAVAADSNAVVKIGGICHRGWYVATAPPLDTLPQVKLTVSADGGDEVWLEWQPEAGRRYAVLAPPSGTWEAGTVYLPISGADGSTQAYPEIALLSQSMVSPVAWIYDVEQRVAGSSEPFYLPVYPQANLPSIYALGHHPRGYTDLYEGHEKLYAAAAGQPIPAQYFLRRYDLTTAEPQQQGPLTVDLGFTPGDYIIHSSEPRLGSEVTLELTGDLERISGEPWWDLDQDAVTDATGTTASFLASAPGSDMVTVTFREQTGEHVRLVHRVNVLSDGILACLPAGNAANYVVGGAAAPPERESSFWVISDQVIGGRSSNSLHITNAAGPLMYIELPAEWAGKRLKEARLVLFVSPRAGDYERMFLSLNVSPVRATADPAGGFEHLAGLDGVIDGKPIKLPGEPYHAVGICWPAELALRAEDNPASGTTARQVWLEYLKSPSVGFWVQTELGFDVYNPPPNAELVAILRALKQSPYYSIKFVTEEEQQLNYAAPLFGTLVTPDTALLVGALLESRNILLAAQYEVYSGGHFPARVELETTDGAVFVRYFDYSILEP